MRVGLLGAAAGYDKELRELCAFLLFELEVDVLIGVASSHPLEAERRSLRSEVSSCDIGGEPEARWNQGGSLWLQALAGADGSPEAIDRFVARERKLLALKRIATSNASVTLPHAGGLQVLASKAELSHPPMGVRILVADGLATPVVRQSGDAFVLNPGDLAQAGAMLVHDCAQHLTISLFDRNARLVAQHKLLAYGGETMRPDSA